MDWDSIGQAVSYVATAIVAIFSTLFARKKAKEDASLAKINNAIEVWKALAESNKEHWDACEKETTVLNARVEELNTQNLDLKFEMIELRQQVSLLTIQIERMKNDE